MKKQISGSCILTPKIFLRWADFHLYRGKRPKLKKLLIMFAIVVSGLLMAAFGLKYGETTLLVCGIAVVLCSFVFTYAVRTSTKRRLKSYRALIEDPYEFVFAPTGLIVTIIHGDGIEKRDFFYDEIKKVYDCNGCLYVYVDTGSCMIVPIGCLKATPDEVREFIADKVKQKYIRCA